ncbi:IS3 family transposase [Sorangium sp. So ce854]|uniref:IS3 family transposase n=1 Tax=Sorangium sp. So ce854 TaxID=3133322 RepID=UPI003F63EA8E
MIRRACSCSRTRSAADAAADYIDSFYNRKQRRSRLARMSPIEYELKSHVTARAAW